MRTKQLLALSFVLFITLSVSAQWVKQTLPKTIGTPAMEYPGAKKGAIGKNAFWTFSRNVNNDSTNLGAVECVRTFDGGKTYQVSTLPFSNIGYFYAPQLVNEGTAYIASANYETGANAVHRSVDSGATWQELSYHPEGFLNAMIFYDANNGIAILDPDSSGSYFAYTTNGGTTFTRLPQTNAPSAGAHEVFYGGGHQVIGDVIFQPAFDSETGDWRMWRSIDRGRNWTAGEWNEEHSGFGPTTFFTDKDNGLWFSGVATPNPQAFYTINGGETWKPSTLPGIPSGGVLSSLPNTLNIVGIFEDVQRRMLFSAATNDLGKTWHSEKDLAPYRPDSIYVNLGIQPFGWSNLDIVDNNTAWAKFSRTELYRYDSKTPIIPEKPDLDLELKADNDGLPLYGSVKYTLTVKNRGISPATGVKINWLPPYKRTNNGAGAYAYQSAYSDKGHYDSWNGVWSLDKIDAGASATATFHLFVVKNNENVTQTAQVMACNESDLDSAPSNMSGAAKEDDEVGFAAQASTDLLSLPNDGVRAKTPEFMVSPNPAKDKINVFINADNDNTWSIRMLNNVGQVVYTQKGQSNIMVDIDVKSFVNGLYLVEYEALGERKIEKIVVQH
jgi:Domain of unknown function DUF11/Secretion system C-terminal sorting domain